MGYKTINYIELIPVLVSKIQSLDAEIEALKNELYILKNKLYENQDNRVIPITLPEADENK